MESSTPVVPSPKRRLTGGLNQSPLIVLNDNLERSARRNHAVLEQRLSNICVPQSPINEKEARDHFQICLKMHAENKINTKNAWNLKIIDYMMVVFGDKQKVKDSFQIAGTSLDISSKIYGIRVDDVYTNSLSLAGNMARAKNRDSNDVNEQNESGEEGESGQPIAKKKKKFKLNGPKCTIAKDSNTLLGDVPKLESIFFQTRVDMESSNIENLFTNKMHFNPAGYKVMIMNKEKAWCSYLKPDPNINFVKKYKVTIPKTKRLSICAPFKNFVLDEWDPDNEKLSSTIEGFINDELVFDDNGLPIQELDGSVHDIFQNDNDDDLEHSEDEIVGVAPAKYNNQNQIQICDFNPQENGGEADDYCFTNKLTVFGNKKIIQIWAGPSHWKLKHLKPATSRFSGIRKKQRTCKSVKKVTDESTLINVNDDPRISYEECKGKRFNIVNSYKCTLPQVQLLSYDIYLNFMLKPTKIKLKTKVTDEIPLDNNIRIYNYDNPNDSQYCTQNMVDNDMDDGHQNDNDDNDDNNPEDMQIPQNFMGDNLIAPPELVPQTYIPYALKAKKMNMKNLKSVIWKELTSHRPQENVSQDGMLSKFSEVYKEIPDKLPEKYRSELSCSLAFAALLHLANEHNLELKGQEDLNDIVINQIHVLAK